jgi:hypothetical protein
MRHAHVCYILTLVDVYLAGAHARDGKDAQALKEYRIAHGVASEVRLLLSSLHSNFYRSSFHRKSLVHPATLLVQRYSVTSI